MGPAKVGTRPPSTWQIVQSEIAPKDPLLLVVGAALLPFDSTNAIVDGPSVLFNVIVTSQVERLAHALNVPLRKERANVHLIARRFRHCASQVWDYTDVAFSFVNPKLSFVDPKWRPRRLFPQRAS
jgi:hypothetical protein